MRHKPLHALGHDGRKRRRGQVKFPHPLSELATFANSNYTQADYEAAHENLMSFFAVLEKIQKRLDEESHD